MFSVEGIEMKMHSEDPLQTLICSQFSNKTAMPFPAVGLLRACVLSKTLGLSWNTAAAFCAACNNLSSSGTSSQNLNLND
jgi:hypothetical protein